MAAPLMRAGCLALGLASATAAHVLLDPEVADGMLAEIGRFAEESRAGPEVEEALYRLGETVEALVGLLNQDAEAHGQPGLFAQLVLERLAAQQVAVRIRDGRFQYDLAAFREYLLRAPAGPRSAAARFRLLERSFRERIGDDPLRIEGADPAELRLAIAEEERFVRDHGADERAAEVQFYLAVDSCRLSLIEKGRANRRRCRTRLEHVAAGRPGSLEARAAQALAERLAR